MVTEATEYQAKERVRTRWTPALDKIFADLIVEQIQLGKRPNSNFDKKTWGYIRDEFNKKTSLNFNNNQLRKHLDVLRTRYTQVKSSLAQNDFIIDDSFCGGIGLWEGIGVNLIPEPVKMECPIYEQLCIIFADNGADGVYAQSSHYELLEHKSNGDNAAVPPPTEVPSSSKSTVYNAASGEKGKKNTSENKRKRIELDQSGQHQREKMILDSMAKAMLEMIEASKLRAFSRTAMEETSSITNCIKALDEIEGLQETLYFAALDLFDDPFMRETFISLTSVLTRSRWLQEQLLVY